MANPEHLEIFKQGVEAWNSWRSQNKERIETLRANAIRSVRSGDLSKQELFYSADLSTADQRFKTYNSVDLSFVKLHNANLSSNSLNSANFHYCDLRYSDLRFSDFVHTDFSTAYLISCDLRHTNLDSTNFSRADLSFANLSTAKATSANFSFANLRSTNFTESNLEGAIFTGACVANWNVDSKTSLKHVQCEYVYQTYDEKQGKFKDRLPRNPNSNFKPGEFEALVKQQCNLTIDLVFIEGIDWQAFFQSFVELRTQYQNSEISIQAIERKGSDFIIRLETTANSDENELIEASAKELYDLNIKQLKAQVENYEKLIEAEKEEKSTLLGIVKAMAENQKITTYQTTINASGSNIAAINSGSGTIQSVSQNIGADMDEVMELIQSLKTIAQDFPEEQRVSIEIAVEDLESDLTAEQKQDRNRLSKRIRTLWLATCAVTVGIAGIADFSNNVLELSEKLDIPIPIELIQQNPHVLPNRTSGGKQAET